MSKTTKLRKTRERKQVLQPHIPLEDKLRTLTNIIVDRIIEDQGRGNLNIFSKKE